MAANPFFTRENASILSTICHNYLSDKHGIDAPEAELMPRVVEAMRALPNTGLPPSEMNRRVVMQVCSAYVTGGGASAPVDRGESDRAAENPGEDAQAAFMARLQQFEIQRNTMTVAPASTPPSAAPPTASAATSSTAPSITTIYVSQPPKNIQTLFVHGWDRSWQDRGAARSSWTWKGPLPAWAASQLALHGVWIPKHHARHPYFILRIASATGQTHDAALTSNEPIVAARQDWELWRPCSAPMPALAVPWRVSLIAPDGQPVALGYDNVRVKSVDPDGHVAFDKALDAYVGDCLWIHGGSKVNVLAISGGTQAIVDPPLEKECIGTTVLVYNRQVLFALEAEKK